MPTILSRLVAVGIIAGGFALTGDLGRLASRGLAVLNARDVPAPPDARPAPGPGTQPAAPATPGPDRPPVTPQNAEFRPPQDGAERVDLASLAPGDRVVIWLAASRSSGGRLHRCLVFDMIDPSASEALAYEAVSLAADGSPKATSAPPRRVRIRGAGADGTVVVGGGVELQRRGVAADGVGLERIGPIVALGLIR
ncbi:MAG: hypothetical protein ACKO6E_05590 [Planctomycetota bacterium]